jgi:hypothetical protein
LAWLGGLGAAGAQVSDQVVQPSAQGTASVGSAAETPLRNANLVRQNLPQVLKLAVAAPYSRPRPYTCGRLAVEIQDLNDALGDDLDAGPAPRAKVLTAPNAVKVAANTFIPWQGVLRFISGAEAHDRKVVQAIVAGATRRAYLKGLGEARGCLSPAAPFRGPQANASWRR